MDLIDRETTLQALCYDCVNRHHCNAKTGRKCSERLLLENVPSIDAQPVRHGRWVELVDGRLYCTQCQQRRGLSWGRYCSYCGAKMDGGVNDGCKEL